jgi:ATP synthase protein I
MQPLDTRHDAVVAFFCRQPFADSPFQADQEAIVRVDDSRVVPLTLLTQAGVTVAVAVVLGVAYGPVESMSALLGGITAVAPNAYLAARLAVPRERDSAEAVVRSARIGVVGKTVLTAVLFGVIFATVRPLSAPAVFGGFIAAQLVVFGGLLMGSGASNVDLGAKS